MRILTTLLLAGALVGCQAEAANSNEGGTPANSATSKPAPRTVGKALEVEAPMNTGELKLTDNYEMRGWGVTEGGVFPAEAVVASPDSFDGGEVRIQGTIVRMCKGEGCWMNLGEKDAAIENTIYVSYEKHESKYFPPLGSDGREVVAQGQISVKETKDGKQELEMLCTGLALKKQ